MFIKFGRQQQEKIIQEKNDKYKKIINYYKLTKPTILRKEYNSIIPLHLYTCWHTKKLPPLMKKNYEFLIESNPKIQFHLYDEEDCRNFIISNFDESVLNAYNSLIPCSYKSDLWRYCVLYINGGIYMDIKYKCVNNFKFITLTEKEYFVRDYDTTHVYTALIITLPNNKIMKNCIDKIVENVKNKNYGIDCLDPTGPTLLAKNFSQDTINSMEMYHNFTCIENIINEYYIVKDDRIILTWYNGYRDEQKNSSKK